MYAYMALATYQGLLAEGSRMRLESEDLDLCVACLRWLQSCSCTDKKRRCAGLLLIEVVVCLSILHSI